MSFGCEISFSSKHSGHFISLNFCLGRCFCAQRAARIQGKYHVYLNVKKYAKQMNWPVGPDEHSKYNARLRGSRKGETFRTLKPFSSMPLRIPMSNAARPPVLLCLQGPEKRFLQRSAVILAVIFSQYNVSSGLESRLSTGEEWNNVYHTQPYHRGQPPYPKVMSRDRLRPLEADRYCWVHFLGDTILSVYIRALLLSSVRLAVN